MKTIELLDPTVIDGLRIIDAEHLSQLVRARDIIREAELEAQSRLVALDAELEEERRTAFSIAYTEGLELFIAAQEQYADAAETTKARLLDLVSSCLLRILDELPPQEVLVALIAPVLADIGSSREVTFVVHPDKLPALKIALERVGNCLPTQSTLSARGDPDVSDSDCWIYTDEEVFSTGIQLVCDHLSQALEEILRLEAQNVD